MFHLSYMSPAKIAGHLKLTSKLSGLGHYKDIHGNTWDVHGILGDYIQARQVLAGDHRYSTAMFDIPPGVEQTTWEPYTYEVVEKELAHA